MSATSVLLVELADEQANGCWYMPLRAGSGLPRAKLRNVRRKIRAQDSMADHSAWLPGHRYGIVAGKEGYLRQKGRGGCGGRLYAEGLAGE